VRPQHVDDERAFTLSGDDPEGLWLQHEHQRHLASMNIEDCTADMAFMQHVLERWKSREPARPGQPG
jgi:hypothetical protein